MPKQNLTTFYIVRHGQTDWNAKKILQGQRDIPLNETGEVQAQKTAEKFKNIKFDLAISSDLMRAKRTAEIIALEHKLAVDTTIALRERTFGALEGKSSTLLFDYFQLINALTKEERLKKRVDDKAESDEEVTTRTITFLRESAVANPGKTILVATHGGVLRLILLHLGYFDYKALDTYRFDNLGYIKITSDGVDFFVKETSGITTSKIRDNLER